MTTTKGKSHKIKFPSTKVTHKLIKKKKKTLPDKHRQHNGGPMLEVGESTKYTAVYHVGGGGTHDGDMHSDIFVTNKWHHNIFTRKHVQCSRRCIKVS